jgi:membrane-associated phospholipid phosphatase
MTDLNNSAAGVDGPIALWLWWLPLVVFALSAPLWLHWWEPAMFVAINTACMPVAAQVWTGLSLLGNGWGVLGVTAPLLVLNPRLMWAWLCAAPFAIAFARTGKYFLESPRPAAVVDNAQMRIVGEVLHNVSMPSGHTLTAFAVASGIFFAIPRARRMRHVWLLVLAAGTGLSRIAVGAHWPGDVAVGASLGLLSGLLGNLLLARMRITSGQPSHWGLRLVAVLVAVAIYHLLTEELDFAENAPHQLLVAGVAVLSLIAFVLAAIRSAKALRAS